MKRREMPDVRVEGLMDSPELAVPVFKAQSHTVYDGFITTEGTDLRVRVSNSMNKSEAKLECDWKLRRFLMFHSQALQKISNIQGNYPTPNILTSRLASHVLAEMKEIGWDKVDSVDETFQQLTLMLCDTAGRKHVLHLNLSPQKEAPEMCTVHLPIPADFNINQDEQVSLQDLMNQFRVMVNKCEDFWEMMYEIDQNTWVLEPEKPGPSVCDRRLALGPSASLHIKVDAAQPRLLPQCSFLGADQDVAPLRECLNKNVHKCWSWTCQNHVIPDRFIGADRCLEHVEKQQEWQYTSVMLPQVTVPTSAACGNVHCSILENLQTVLETTLPSPKTSSREKFTLECGICYSYRLGGAIPDNVCGDQCCGQTFHHQCLYEWLRGLPCSRQSFNRIYGECPFCSKCIDPKSKTSEEHSGVANTQFFKKKQSILPKIYNMTMSCPSLSLIEQ